LAQPPPYNRQFNFQNQQALTPATPLLADKVDLEYNSIKITIDQLLAKLALLQADDGTLAPYIVGTAQLSPTLSLGFTPPVAWSTGVNFSVNATVFFAAKLYICKIAHLSGSFTDDLAAVRWSLLADFVAAVNSAINIAFSPAGTIVATTVQAAITELDNETQTALTARAPAAGEYIVAAAHADLTAERVATNTPTISWDVSVAAQAKANIIDASVTAAKLQDAAVSAVKLGTDAVTTAKILDANVTAAKLAADAVTTAKILDANVTAAKLAADAVTTAKILDANVTAAKLAADAKTLPTRQVLLSGGAATYTTPAGCRQLRVRMVGSGGGGGAAITNNGANGAATIFNAINANPGSGGGSGGASGASGGAGGSGGGGAASFRMAGNPGPAWANAAAAGVSGFGGSSVFGGSGGSVRSSAGAAAVANSGSGGGGGGGGDNQLGAGGGAGEYVELIINSPAATYIYTVPAGGAGGAAGVQAGGNGGSGIIIIDEFY